LPEYTEINWKDAACAGMDVEVFYRLEEIRYPDPDIYIKPLRALCASCPLWKSCLSYAASHEFYGWWGGMDTTERQALINGGRTATRLRVYEDFEQLGITRSMIHEALEEK